MKQLFIFILSIPVISHVYSRPDEHLSLPDFSKVRESGRTDSIHSWFVSTVLLSKQDPSKALLQLRQLIDTGKQAGDSLTIYAGISCLGYYSVEQIADTSGYARINEALEFYRRNNMKREVAYVLYDLAMLYYYRENPVKSLELQLRSYELCREIGFEKCTRISEILFNLSYRNYYIGNYGTCIGMLHQATQYIGLIGNEKGREYLTKQTANTLGLAHSELGNTDSAMFYFTQTMEEAQLQHDSAWIGIAAGNIGAIYMKEQQYTLAWPYMELYYHCSVKEKKRMGGPSISEALIFLAEIHIANGETASAIGKLEEAKQILSVSPMHFHPNKYRLLEKLYRVFAKAYGLKQDFILARKYNVLAMAMNDTAERTNITSQYTNILIQLEEEKNRATVKEFETETEHSLQLRDLLLGTTGLAGLFLFSLYNRQRFKNRKDEGRFKHREDLLLSEKRDAEKQLSEYMQKFQEKNNMIEGFQLEISHLKALPYSSEKLQTIETLEKLQKLTIITENDWLRFRQLFEKAHPHFFERVKEKYPEVTQAEMRLLALMKLNISTKEMAGMLGISTQAIRRTGYRFLKKIGDPGEVDLRGIVELI